MVHGSEVDPDRLEAAQSLSFEVREDQAPDVDEVKFPEFHMTSVLEPDGAEGMAYLERRGITRDMAEKYELHFSKLERRVYFPVMREGRCYGYQGRHIDNVDKGFRMRNNDAFRRDVLVMFADNLDGSDFAILAEGPFDALKFESVGSNVCSMGKAISQRQLDIIYSFGIKKLYLALDDDAAYEINQIVKNSPVETYRIFVPDSCIQRCKAQGKDKADFGECTFEEAAQAFSQASKIDASTVLIHIGEG